MCFGTMWRLICKDCCEAGQRPSVGEGDPVAAVANVQTRGRDGRIGDHSRAWHKLTSDLRGAGFKLK